MSENTNMAPNGQDIRPHQILDLAFEGWKPPPDIMVACLQFAPELGKVEENIRRANTLLEKDKYELLEAASTGKSLWLVLPEMAFSGYNFKSIEEIEPFLEPCGTGPSSQWAVDTARRYSIYVTVGYPELVVHTGKRYNSTITVSDSGSVIGMCRKHFLYYTDETWSEEGQNRTLAGDKAEAFFSKDFGAPIGRTSMGICMDINNYKFLTPFNKYEFANHVLDSKTPLVVLSNAWLTHLLPEQLAAGPGAPDNETLIYWTERFHPVKEVADRMGKETVVVIANRTGTEGAASYAGTSCVMRFKRGKIEIYDLCGRSEERLMIVDLASKAKYALQRGG